MVYLAITPVGLAKALSVATETDAVWCGSDAISEADYATLTLALNRFTYELADRQMVDGAISTIEEHHPGQIVWVEAT